MQSLSSRLARGALDAALDAMIIIDGTSTILFANRQDAAPVAEALKHAIRNSRIDLLVTDFHLADGTSASLRAALDRPLKAVLMTEDTSSAVKELRDPLVAFVSKPVNADHRSLVRCDPARQSATATPILHFIVH